MSSVSCPEHQPMWMCTGTACHMLGQFACVLTLDELGVSLITHVAVAVDLNGLLPKVVTSAVFARSAHS
eukprot:8725875-Pyramimonas_sp.AAC.1